ncbi:MAG: hypothetical protein EP319_04770 [Deltaproteobacteria bacterium]|nr:MAG: hypothetical protein EP319_04770 [Deltaproteobacteria bacterium]
MCDVCDVEEIDTYKVNGENKIYGATLYTVMPEDLTVDLCKLHSIQLFLVGEKRFLENNPTFCEILQIHNKMFYKTIVKICAKKKKRKYVCDTQIIYECK